MFVVVQWRSDGMQNKSVCRNRELEKKSNLPEEKSALNEKFALKSSNIVGY